MAGGIRAEFGSFLTVPPWPLLLYPRCHIWLSGKLFQQLKYRADFLLVIRRERTNGLPEKQPGSGGQATQQLQLHLMLSWYHRSAHLDQLWPAPGLGEGLWALWLLGSSKEDGAQHLKGSYSLSVPPPPDITARSQASLACPDPQQYQRGGMTAVRDRCLESVCTPKAVFSST